MNTLEELISFGLSETQAKSNLDNCKTHIGQVNGDFEITDVTYLDSRERDIELTCMYCGAVIHKLFLSGRNKWCELQKCCVCRNNAISEKSPKTKRAVLRNDDSSFVGKTYGTLKVVEFDYKPHKSKSGGTISWICECIECNKRKIVNPGFLKSGKEKCICQKSIQAPDVDKYIGQRFGRLIVTRLENKKTSNSYHWYADCVCDCGKQCTVQLDSLKSSATRSCGCYAKEIRQKQKNDYRKTASP